MPRRQGPSSAAASHATLVVDLDGTLTPSDTLMEQFINVARQSPLCVLRLPFWLARGRAELKERLAARGGVSPGLLPYREAFLDYLREERAGGRRLVLATAAHRSIADAIAGHLGLFDRVLATEGRRNLKGSAKLEAIRESEGEAFVYAGDSRADIPIWKAAKGAVLVGVAPGTAELVRRSVTVEREFPDEEGGLAPWLRAMRLHQWLKNLLLFVPLLTAFQFLDLEKLAATVVAFLAFSLTASATYVANDLWDLESDRAHPRKRFRPLASARLSIAQGLGLAASALGLGLAMAFAVSVDYLLMVLLYLALTSAYSWTLKSYVLIDVLTLSLLYTLRILAGSVAIGVAASSWLLAFSAFMFLSLALVKRCAELVSLEVGGMTAVSGRDYRATDLVVLWPLGVGAALSSVVVFGLYISAATTEVRYGTPQLLWLAAVALTYWLARLWVKTSRGEMHDDPVVYAIRDRGSRVAVLGMFGIFLLARYLTV